MGVKNSLLKTRNIWYRGTVNGEEACQGPCHAKFFAITAVHPLPLTRRALTVPRHQISQVLSILFLYSCSKPEHLLLGDHSYTTGNRTWNLRYDSWRLSHLCYLYPETTPVVTKLDHNWSCLWVYIAQGTKAPTITYTHTQTHKQTRRILQTRPREHTVSVFYHNY